MPVTVFYGITLESGILLIEKWTKELKIDEMKIREFRRDQVRAVPPADGNLVKFKF